MTVPSVSLFFLSILSIGVLVLIWWHSRDDKFDLRDSITSPGTDGVRRVDTSKTILVGAFLTSSYLLAENYSDTAYGLYLGAWILNGGAVLLQKVLNKPSDGSVLK